ncbi:MAG: hypothetical protein RLN82_03500 [Pseudomonadales bacterium]
MNAANEFEENWPPLNETLSEEALPRMIRLEITMLDGFSVERLIPGVEYVPSAPEGNNNGEESPENPDD